MASEDGELHIQFFTPPDGTGESIIEQVPGDSIIEQVSDESIIQQVGVSESTLIMREPQQVITIELPQEEANLDSNTKKLTPHDQVIIDKSWDALQAKLLSLSTSLINSKKKRANGAHYIEQSTNTKDLIQGTSSTVGKKIKKRKSISESVNSICDLPVKKSADRSKPEQLEPVTTARNSTRLKNKTYKYKHYQLSQKRINTGCSCGGNRDRAIMESYLVRLKKLPEDVKAYVHLQMSQILFNAENPHLPQQHVTPYINPCQS